MFQINESASEMVAQRGRAIPSQFERPARTSPDRRSAIASNGQTWLEALPPEPADGEARPARSGDSVSPIVIVSNDLAAGWAGDRYGEPLYPLVPGGPRQREMALRGGINLVMYTLTGNYKADQVHVRDLLNRLGH